MAAVVSLLVVLALSFFITRVATIALSLTGLSHQHARFQAVSAYTGVGFTTMEAEDAVSHPVRRRIVMTLMILGNIGVVTAVSSLILSFTDLQQGQWWVRALWLGGGVLLIWVVRSSRRLGRALDVLIRAVLRHTTDLRVIDYRRTLQLGDDYEVRTLRMGDDDWLTGRSLSEARIFQEGLVVLGIHRTDGHYLGVPRGETTVRRGDQIVLYGPAKELRRMEQRRQGQSGDQEHARAVEKTQKNRSEEKSRDTQRSQ